MDQKAKHPKYAHPGMYASNAFFAFFSSKKIFPKSLIAADCFLCRPGPRAFGSHFWPGMSGFEGDAKAMPESTVKAAKAEATEKRIASVSVKGGANE